ncbi:MAG: type IV pilus secretin PilQ [Proteobacteria bacterium]|nr:type IV pilus secretin PilQ [Desulfobacteraceae bacterium]MBU4012794.1 type IV pilus secretin PilQ [Pseudomonadota bacterium]MBU4067577.1 type IV pilus secretin PilQ [Pseudomonadota bacterium]MBU4101856.1 type IV pilus secretin PilQ [Pseudomonadota bacterium]MBU4126830.1 type IV pilus secretin PilQ [Pseudomonadota bacterium]
MSYGNYKSSKIRVTAILLVILIAVFTGCAQNMAAKKDMELSPEPKLITEISTSEDSESFNVLVKGNRMLTYMSVKQLFPLAVLLYFPETALDNINTNISPESEIIGPITASELTEKGHKSKIEILLKKDVPYKADSEGTGLKISFSKPSKALSSPILSSSEPAEKPVEKAKKPAWVNRIDFSSEEAGKSTIIIGTTGPVEYRIKKASPQLLQLKLLNTRLPDYRKFPLITTRFESAVDRIIPIQTPAMKNTSMFTIELRESVPYFIEQAEGLLSLHFEASSISPRPLEDAKLPAWKKILAQTVTKEEIDIDEETPEGLVAEKYTGEKIALDFYETDIKNVFRILKEVSGKNFAIDKDVAGKVTLTLDKPVPWDQVLDLVLKMNQLGQIFEGDIIRIATAETLKKEDVFKRDKIALEPLTTAYISVNYANADQDIRPKIEAILTENRGSVSADKRTNIIIMTDVEAKIEKAREIINSLDIPTRQVMIEARIVEATVDFAREIGISWGGNFYQTSSHGSGRVDTTGRLFGAYAGGDYDGDTANYAVNLPGANLFTTAKGAGLGFTFGRIGGSTLDLDIRLMAMETNAEGKIISAPKIATLDNETARIKQGYDFPFKQFDESGNTTITWKPVDLLLEVTPHITSDNRVSMAIKTTKNDLKSTGLSETPMMTTTKEAETKLLVSDGETIVIGGIIKETLNWSESKVPLLGDIPILGWLFKTKYRVTEKSELLIFITPRVIHLEQQGKNTDYKY